MNSSICSWTSFGAFSRPVLHFLTRLEMLFACDSRLANGCLRKTKSCRKSQAKNGFWFYNHLPWVHEPFFYPTFLIAQNQTITFQNVKTTVTLEMRTKWPQNLSTTLLCNSTKEIGTKPDLVDPSLKSVRKRVILRRLWKLTKISQPAFSNCRLTV